MDGDFKTDITRDSFNVTNILKASKQPRSFSRVLKQQGRVDLDADWNELVDILLYQQRTALADIIGPHAAPADAAGFVISGPKNTNETYTVTVGNGRYYVDGILCNHLESEECVIPEDEHARADANGEAHYLIYLDVWEREVTALEDDAIRESALGGPDTATRAEVVFQVRFGDVSKLTKEPPSIETAGQFWTDQLRGLALQEHGQLLAHTDPMVTSTDPCVTPPSSSFRGLENQLYRVEIHRGGTAYPDSAIPPPRGGHSSSYGSASRDTTQHTVEGGQTHATFKWSRENGSVTFAVVDGSLGISETIAVTLKNLGPDDTRYSLREGNWVELIDLSLVPNEAPDPLFQVETVDNATMQVTLTIGKGQTAPAESDLNGPFLLRRWDYKAGDPEDTANNDRPITIADDGAAMLVENHWLTLEAGVQIGFSPDRTKKEPTEYRSGDYWLIPARTSTGELEWPFTIDARGQRQADPLPPHGVVHHYAPLALVTLNGSGGIVDKGGKPDITDLRRRIKTGWEAF